MLSPELPMVTILIPAYNCASYIDATLDSALGQTYSNIEILVIDDCSTDNTVEVLQRRAAKESRITLLKNENNLGVAETRNRGMAQANGEYIAFLDADDLWVPAKLELQMQRVYDAALEVCYTGYAFIDQQGDLFGRPYRVPEAVTFEGLLRENVIGCSTVVLHRHALRETYMRTEYAHEDYVFWLELCRSGLRFGGVASPLTLYRVHPANRSSNKMNAALARWKIYRRFLGLSWCSSAKYFIHYASASIQKRL